jgi:hypothetical protein
VRVARTDTGIAQDSPAVRRKTHPAEQLPHTVRTVKRSLPMRVAPIPGEALESWLAALAVRMDATWGELLDAVLPTGADGMAAIHRGGVLTTGLTDEERQTISAATGLGAADLDSMTLTGSYGAPLITTDRRTGRARTPWGLVYRQRYCPLCMKARPGRRKLEWLLPWTFACVQHRCFLADSCPQCTQQQSASDWLARRRYPHPDRCDRLGKDFAAPRRCTARLSKTHPDRLQEKHPVLSMQHRLTELLAAQTVDAGVYHVFPVSAEQLLVDVHVLGNWITRAPNLVKLIGLFDGRVTDHRIGLWGRRLSVPPIPGRADDSYTGVASAERIALASPAAWVGAGVTAALSVLMQHSLDRAAHTLRAVMPSVVTRELRYHQRRSGVVHSPVVTAVDLKARAADFPVLQQLRYRTITDLPRLPDTARYAPTSAMLHCVPTLFWPEWAFRLDTADLPWNTARQVMSRLLLTIGCTMAEHNLRRHLRSSVNSQRLALAANDLRRHPQWTAIITALLRLHEHLQNNPAPIDYQRRRTLNYDDLLPEPQWTQLVANEGFRTAPTTAAAARLWLTEKLSGAPVTGAPLSCPGQCGDRVRGTLTPELVSNLNTVCVDYLRGHGICDEPITWVPPLSLLEDLSLPGAPPDVIDPLVIHSMLATGLGVPAVARRLGVCTWKVRYQLEEHPMPSTMRATRHGQNLQGRSRITAREFVRVVLPEPEMRDLYQRQGLSFDQIAAQLNVPGTLDWLSWVVSGLADEYGIRRRPPRGASLGNRRAGPGVGNRAPRSVAPSDPQIMRLYTALSVEPQQIPVKMRGEKAWVRVQSFIDIAQYRDLSSAANALGYSCSWASCLVSRLEADLDHVLIERAVSCRQPMSLTPFGKRLLRAAAHIDDR